MQRRWEPWRWGPWGLAIGSYDDEFRRSSKLIFLPLQKRLKNSALTIPRSFHIWKEVERWKGSVSGCLMSWLKIKKNFFWNAIFSYCMQHTISWLDCDVWWKVDLYDNQQWPAQWLDWEEAPKHFSKPNLHQKKVMVKKKKKKKDHGHCLVVCCPSDPLQLSESRWNHYIWEVCSANWWDAPKTATSAGSIGQLKGPNSPRHPTTRCTSSASKVEPTGLWSFASSTVFT